MDSITDFIEDAPVISGIIALLLAAMISLYLVHKNEPLKMNKHSTGSWKALVNLWAVLLMLLIFGIILILKNI